MSMIKRQTDRQTFAFILPLFTLPQTLLRTDRLSSNNNSREEEDDHHHAAAADDDDNAQEEEEKKKKQKNPLETNRNWRE